MADSVNRASPPPVLHPRRLPSRILGETSNVELNIYDYDGAGWWPDFTARGNDRSYQLPGFSIIFFFRRNRERLKADDARFPAGFLAF